MQNSWDWLNFVSAIPFEGKNRKHATADEHRYKQTKTSSHNEPKVLIMFESKAAGVWGTQQPEASVWFVVAVSACWWTVCQQEAPSDMRPNVVCLHVWVRFSPKQSSNFFSESSDVTHGHILVHSISMFLCLTLMTPLRKRTHALHWSEVYLCDGAALKHLTAVDPSAATRDALCPIARRQRVRGEAGGVREAEVEGLIPGSCAEAVPALVWRRGSGEDAHHHVEGEQDLRQTDPYVQDLLVFAETSYGREDLIEIHCLLVGFSEWMVVEAELETGFPTWRGDGKVFGFIPARKLS